MHYQFSCALKLARKYEIEHWSRSSKAINWSADSFQKTRHVDELTHEPAIWSCDTSQWLSCFDSCQLTILWMSNIHDVDLPRDAWDTPPSLLIVSPTLPLDAYARTYARQITWQPNEKRLTIFYEYGALYGAPLLHIPINAKLHNIYTQCKNGCQINILLFKLKLARLASLEIRYSFEFCTGERG